MLHCVKCLAAPAIQLKYQRSRVAEQTLCFRYTGHKNESYKIDSVISSSDKYIFSGSEDGHVYVWDLVEVRSASLLA